MHVISILEFTGHLSYTHVFVLSLSVSATGRVAVVEMAPDPAVSPVDAALYFRCRKCRQLLFTDGDVLQHTLGEGRESFSRRHRGKKDWSKVSSI